jgi:hypothetical protein
MANLLELDTQTEEGSQRVYVKTRWEDPWVEYPGLWCSALEWGTIPSMGAAQLEWKVFKGVLPGETSVSYHAWLSLDRKFIKVEYQRPASAGTLRWFGFVDLDRQQRKDTIRINGQKVGTGEQSLGVAGIEQLLDDTPLLNGWFLNVSGVTNYPDRIGFAPTFNEDGKPNRSKVKVEGAYAFSKYSQNADYWSTADIIEYLMVWFRPVDGSGAFLAQIQIDNAGVLPTWDRPEIKADGRTVWEVLSELLHGRRALGGFLTAKDDHSQPWVLRPFTHCVSTIVVSNENENQKIFFNATQWNLALDWGRGAQRDGRPDLISIIDRRMESKYDRVVARGAKRRTCFSTYFATTPSVSAWLERDWTSTEQAAYDAGGSGRGDYPTAKPTSKKEMNTDVRTDDKLEHVFARYKLDDLFFGTVQGPYLTGDYPVFDETPADPASNWPLSWRFSRTLPLYEGQVYTSMPLPKWPYQNTTKAEPKPLAPMVFIQLGATIGWVRGDVHGMPGTDGRDWSLDVRVEEFPPRLWLKTNGAPQHKIADSHFSVLPDALEVSPQYDWAQDLFATICLEESRFAEAIYPASFADNGANIAACRTKVIDCGDDFRLDWVTGRTAYGVSPVDGTLQTSPDEGGYVRDDRNYLMQFARAAYDFYRRTRACVKLQKPGATAQLWLGEMIVQLGRSGDPANAVQECNTVVTRISLAFPQGRALPMQSWTTSSSELDAMEFLK